MRRVRWEIDVDADSPREAARKALEIQRDPDSIATVFDVIEPNGRVVRVDLTGKSQPDEERLSALLRAMQCHGDCEGTETQLGDAEEFLSLAFGRMSAEQQTEFLESREVIEFIDRELNGDEPPDA